MRVVLIHRGGEREEVWFDPTVYQWDRPPKVLTRDEIISYGSNRWVLVHAGEFPTGDGATYREAWG